MYRWKNIKKDKKKTRPLNAYSTKEASMAKNVTYFREKNIKKDKLEYQVSKNLLGRSVSNQRLTITLSRINIPAGWK